MITVVISFQYQFIIITCKHDEHKSVAIQHYTYRQTIKQTESKSEPQTKPTQSHSNPQANKQTESHLDTQANRQTKRQKLFRIHRETDKQTENHSDTQTNRQTFFLETGRYTGDLNLVQRVRTKAVVNGDGHEKR